MNPGVVLNGLNGDDDAARRTFERRYARLRKTVAGFGNAQRYQFQRRAKAEKHIPSLRI
jgi:ribosomal protein L44E